MTVDWFGAWGSWVGAAATFLTALVAVWIALDGNARERRRREAEDEGRRQALVRSLLHVHALMAMFYAGNEEHPQADLATKGLRAVIDSALGALAFSLSQPFANAELLEHALNLQTTLTMIAGDIAAIPPGAGWYSVADAKKMLAPFEKNLAERQAILEAML